MKRIFSAGLVLALAVGLAAPQARADVKPHALFGDGMVLQQGVSCPVWGTAAPGEAVTAKLDTGGRTFTFEAGPTGPDGRWGFRFPPLPAGGPYTLTLQGKNTVTLKDVHVGEVWVCSGQSNMEWSLNQIKNEEAIQNARNPRLRLFTVPKHPAVDPVATFQGEPKWHECNPETVRNFSAVAYFFGRDLQKARNVTVGLIHTSWGGTRAEAWTSRPVLESHEEWRNESANYHKTADRSDKAKVNPNAPSALYNGMIAPLIPYAVKGVIWYQGESNAGQAYRYRKLFPAMIRNWRDDWGEGDFPFLFVQLAPWISRGDKSERTWAELREAQRLTMKNVKNTAMAVITDVGDPNDIHPRKKEPVGARLALAARALAYGDKVEYSGPLYEGMKVEGDKVVLSFTHVGKGLEARGEELQGFTVAGEDKVFHPAKAEIKGDKVVVRSDKVSKPVAVRYGWSNNPTVNLWNKDGLPASPFRTDDFPMETGPKPAGAARK